VNLFDPVSYLIVSAGIFAGALVSSLVGFAFSAVAGVVLLHILPPTEAVPLMMACSIVTQGVSLVALRRTVQWRGNPVLIAAGALGIVPALYLLQSVDAKVFRIGFGAFLLAQTAMLFAFKYTRWQQDFERLLDGNGYLATEFISILTVSVVMLIPQIMLLMPLYATLVGGDLVAKEAEDGTLRMILSRPISRLRLLFVKWSAGIIFAVVLVLALGLTALGFASLLFPWKGMFVFLPGQAFCVLSAHEGLVRFACSHLFLAVNASVMMS